MEDKNNYNYFRLQLLVSNDDPWPSGRLLRKHVLVDARVQTRPTAKKEKVLDHFPIPQTLQWTIFRKIAFLAFYYWVYFLSRLLNEWKLIKLQEASKLDSESCIPHPFLIRAGGIAYSIYSELFHAECSKRWIMLRNVQASCNISSSGGGKNLATTPTFVKPYHTHHFHLLLGVDY